MPKAIAEEQKNMCTDIVQINENLFLFELLHRMHPYV